jgi:hypothetical protein
MTDKKDGPAGEHRDAGGSSSAADSARPHATLDLKATEIKTAPASGTQAPSGGTAQASTGTPKTHSASKADAGQSKPPPKSSRPGAQTGGRPRPSRIGSTLSHLTAGLVGGAVAFGAAQYGPVRIGEGSGQLAKLSETNEALLERLSAIESRQEKFSSDPPVPQKLAGMDTKIEEIDRVVGNLQKANATLSEQTATLKEGMSGESSPAARVGNLEKRLDLLASAGGNSDSLPQLTALTGKITDLETSVATQISELRNNIPGEIETRVTAIAEASEAAKAGAERIEREISSVRTDTARLSQRLEANKADADRRASTLRALRQEAAKLSVEMRDLKIALDAKLMGFAKADDVAAAVAPVAGRVTALSQDLTGILQGEDARKANAQRIILALELGNLKRALERGQPYVAELAEVRKAASGTLDLQPLASYADTGVSSLADIEAAFRPLANAVIDAGSEPAEGSVVERLIAGAKTIVRVRKTTYSQDDKSAEAAVARIEDALKTGRLGDVLEHAASIPPKAAEPLQDWLEKVKARQTVDDALGVVETELKASLTGAPPPSAEVNEVEPVSP